MKYRLTASSENEHGYLGLILQGLRTQNSPDSGSGYQLAHDIVEHVNGIKAIGGIEDELEAVGAIWLVRGHSGDIRRPYRSHVTPHENVAADIAAVAEYWYGRKLRFTQTKAHDHDDDFDDLIGIARTSIKNNGSLTGKQIDKYLIAAKHLMRSGARKLERRFKRLDYQYPEQAANTLFYNIVEKVETQCQQLNEGEEYCLQIVGTDARITWIEPKFYY